MSLSFNSLVKFQAIIRDSLDELQGVKNISDDIIIYGKDQAEHDLRLRKVFERLCEKKHYTQYVLVFLVDQ
jgi:hypothetical protein